MSAHDVHIFQSPHVIGSSKQIQTHVARCRYAGSAPTYSSRRSEFEYRPHAVLRSASSSSRQTPECPADEADIIS
jgi:hypothetical protein